MNTFKTTYLEKYKSRVIDINTQPLLYTVAGNDERMLQKTNSIFVQNPTYLQIQMHDKTVINISELNALVVPFLKVNVI